MARPGGEAGLIRFAEKVILLLQQGGFTATNKFAVLIGLMDLCLEQGARNGAAPESVTTRQLAEKVIALYWPQTNDYKGRTLRQNVGGEAKILSEAIDMFLQQNHFRNLRQAAEQMDCSVEE